MNSKQLHSTRPEPLTVNKKSSKIMKKPPPPVLLDRSRSPVIVYLRSPKVIHVSPQEFKSLVQYLTGNQGSAEVSSNCFSSSLPSSCVMEVDEISSHEVN
ncbi:unnamed protein product [Ilex paraguariensis]|uniref:VQ domain-containing protein n=1 Tax=Ilex paraguariensis TaxID=185542 RepID=A0ABC8S700_9AQUA